MDEKAGKRWVLVALVQGEGESGREVLYRRGIYPENTP